MTEEDIKNLRILARRVQGLSGTYTRIPGGNGDRVADLLSADTYELGTKILEILDK